MADGALDVVGIGNAMVDVLSHADEDLVARQGLAKGTMRLVDEVQARALYDAMGPGVEMSGGSAANTMVGVASFGGRAHYVGKVRDDQLGDVFGHDLRATGVGYDTPRATSGPPTGRCLILVTPDGQRTMNTCPGASHQLRPEALDEKLIASASVLMLEGYLWGPDLPRKALVRAIEIARESKPEVAFTLSESVCLPGRREALTEMIGGGGVDLLFLNDHEALQLTGERELGNALGLLSAKVGTLVVTRGAEGALGLQEGKRVEVAAAPVENVVDTTGAGDLFAAGFLAARCRGRDLAGCLETGAICAAEIISHFGARPEADLRELTGL